MTLIWLKHPVLWHSSRVPSGYNYTATTAEQIKLIRTRWHNWYTADWDYARATVYFFCAAIFVFGIINLVFQLRNIVKTSGVVRKLPLYGKIVAASRSIGARQFYLPVFDYYSPPLSAIAIVASMITFFAALTFAVRPYTWPNMAMGHSPPIATRSGWISIAILPFLLVFATKVNLIGMVTGVSHEKLQVYHRWTAWIMYITSLIHTFPFIVQGIHHGEMVSNWKSTPWYWTGVAALVPQTWLIFMSWGPIRNRYYETFKKLHFIASGIFVPALFVHCNFRLTSWDYFWTSAALYGVAWFARYVRTLFNGLGSKASIESLPEDMLKISIPTTLEWRPGQHFFIRFLGLGIHCASSHPFTVSSLPETTAKGDHNGRVIEMYVRVHGGITARLATLAKSGNGRTSWVLLDGPYGGLEGNLKVYDRVLLLAGGSGVTFVIPLLLDLVHSFDPAKVACRKVHLVWAVRTNDALSWFDEVLTQAVKGAPCGLSMSISYYVTDTATPDDDDSSAEVGKAEVLFLKNSGRPTLGSIVEEFCQEDGSVAVATCGPNSFNLDVGRAVSECQLNILRGRVACTEIYMHRESYSW